MERKGRESVIEEGEWRPLYGGAEGQESSNKEIKRRSLYGGALGGEMQVEK